ncbi:hypothetical protein DFJ58DRAFT_733341 [Suillus subalutaceus]|uniref:uncharacterized protein n=1 Tax=Suillus subalutaceus TaxID=48586 RepID=UPI001B869430|nr:uncharacterized protein DFJ58DRAFT_733341 [Suillus subalutaceus]KAG1839465.1 hypothetical protein DFJ58DRAFT_733341 [Suillus subalutaceus]
MPLDGQSAQNLLEVVHADFPWYSDLDSIWHNNPSMAAKTYSSQPGIDHAGTGPSLNLAPLLGLVPPYLAAQSSRRYPPPNMCPPPQCVSAPQHISAPLHISTDLIRQRAIECERSHEASQNV